MQAMKRLSLSIITLLLLFASPFSNAANLSSMSKDEVTAAFSDKTITTISATTLNDELISNSFTGYFSSDGKMSGKFATKPNNGPQNDTGTWKVNSDGTFCFTWDHWDFNKEKCITVYKLDNGLLIVNEKNGFESFILNKDIKSGNQTS